MGEPCRLMPESACVHRSYPALRWGCPPSPAGVATPPVLTARCGRAGESRIVPLRTSYQPGASALHSFYLFQYQPACGLPELRATLVGVKRGTSGWRSHLPTAGLLSQTALGGCCPEPEADGAGRSLGPSHAACARTVRLPHVNKPPGRDLCRRAEGQALPSSRLPQVGAGGCILGGPVVESFVWCWFLSHRARQASYLPSHSPWVLNPPPSLSLSVRAGIEIAKQKGARYRLGPELEIW